MLHAIGKVMKQGTRTNVIGYRIYDSKTGKYTDASTQSIINALNSGTYIKNIAVQNNYVFMCGGCKQLSSIGNDTNSFIVIGEDDGVYICINSSGNKRYITSERLLRSSVEHEFSFHNAFIDKYRQEVVLEPPFDTDVRAKKRQTKPEIERTNLKLDVIGNTKYRILDNGSIMLYDKCIEAIKIPSSCTNIASNEFKSCKDLKCVHMSDSVVSIGTGAFEYCEKLVEVRVGAGLKKIGNNSFKHTGIKSMILPNGLIHIGNKAFNNCVDLELLVIPNTVEFIGHNALYNLQSLKKLVISDEMYYHCGNTGLEKTVKPRGKVEIQLV